MSRHRPAAHAALAVCAGLWLPSPCPAGVSFTITPLVLEGDLVPGVGLVTTIDNIAVNSSGQWLVEADTDNPDTEADSVLIRNGALDWREGAAVAAPPGASINTFDSVTLSDTGRSGYNFFLSGTAGTTDDSGVYDFFDPGSDPFTGTVLVVQESGEAPGLSPGTPFIGFFDVKINNQGRLFVTASVDDPIIPTTVDRALYILDTEDEVGGISAFDLVAAEGDVLPGQIDGVADFGTGPHASAFNDIGDVLFFADLDGLTTVDGAIYVYDGLDRLLLAQEGSASPVLGRNWSSLSSPELDLNNNGDYVYSGTLDGDAATATLIARNTDKFRQEGDPVSVPTGDFLLTGFGTGPIEISDSGQVLWFGDWDDANTAVDTAIWLDDTLLVQEGMASVAGPVFSQIRGIEDGYHMSGNGRFIIFEAVLGDGTDGAFLIEIAQPCPWDCDDSKDGNSNVADLLALLGQYDVDSPDNCTGGSCDYDASGCVDVVDLLKLLAHYTTDPGGIGCP